MEATYCPKDVHIPYGCGYDMATWLSLWYQWPQTTLLIRPCPLADLPQLSLPPGFREAGSILGMCPWRIANFKDHPESKRTECNQHV